MKQCRCLKKILAGENTEQLRRHLEECPECAAAKTAWDLMKQTSSPVEVPELLSANIRNYAASQANRKQHRFRLKYIWMPAAAAFFICIGLSYSIGLPSFRAGGHQTQLQLEAYSEMDSLDSDLIALTAQLEQTSDSLLGETLLSSIMDNQKQNSSI